MRLLLFGSLSWSLGTLWVVQIPVGRRLHQVTQAAFSDLLAVLIHGHLHRKVFRYAGDSVLLRKNQQSAHMQAGKQKENHKNIEMVCCAA